MTLEKANELLAVQALMRGDYNHNGAKLKLADVQREDAVDQLISILKLARTFGFKPGTEF